MKILKIILLIYAFGCLIGAILTLQKINNITNLIIVIYLTLNAVVIIAGSFFEGRYKSNDNPQEGWQKTQERFIDNTSGKSMQVYYNPKAGERSYRKVKDT